MTYAGQDRSGRKPRPAHEVHLVRKAVATAPPTAPRAPLARELARRVVAELAEFIMEDDGDPVAAAMNRLKRNAFPSPAFALATDFNLDTVELFVDERVERLRARSGRALSLLDDAAERRAIFRQVEQRLFRRYLRHMRRREAL